MTAKSKLLLLLGLKALFLLLFILYGPLRLAPDEAQYWTWSQTLDWGYYSKPPAIAWQIYLTTALLGNHELGVRAGALLVGLLLPLLLFRIAKELKWSDASALWAALALACSPLGFFLSFGATTDGGSTLFFLLALFAVIKGPHYLLAGVAIALGALYKWTAFAFWPFILVLAYLFPHLRKKSLLGGIALSLLALLPSLYWNLSHDWATFRHVGMTVVGRTSRQGNALEFLLGQIVLFSPLYFWDFLVGWVRAVLHERRWQLFVIAAFPTALGLYFLIAFFMKVQINWSLYLLPPAFLLVAFQRRGLLGATLLSLALIGGALATPLLPFWPYKASPFRQNLGWEGLTGALLKAGYHPEEEALMADTYQLSSLLSFYGPEQKRAYFLNLQGRRRNQFSYWPGLPLGASGLFAKVDNHPFDPSEREAVAALLRLSFEEVEWISESPLFGPKTLLLFRCSRYNGKIKNSSSF